MTKCEDMAIRIHDRGCVTSKCQKSHGLPFEVEHAERILFLDLFKVIFYFATI